MRIGVNGENVIKHAVEDHKAVHERLRDRLGMEALNAPKKIRKQRELAMKQLAQVVSNIST